MTFLSYNKKLHRIVRWPTAACWCKHGQQEVFVVMRQNMKHASWGVWWRLASVIDCESHFRHLCPCGCTTHFVEKSFISTKFYFINIFFFFFFFSRANSILTPNCRKWAFHPTWFYCWLLSRSRWNGWTQYFHSTWFNKFAASNKVTNLTFECASIFTSTHSRIKIQFDAPSYILAGHDKCEWKNSAHKNALVFP